MPPTKSASVPVADYRAIAANCRAAADRMVTDEVRQQLLAAAQEFDERVVLESVGRPVPYARWAGEGQEAVMTDEPRELTPPLPHDDGYATIPSIKPIEEDECGDPVDDEMKRQSGISTRRDHDRAPDPTPG